MNDEINALTIAILAEHAGEIPAGSAEKIATTVMAHLKQWKPTDSTYMQRVQDRITSRFGVHRVHVMTSEQESVQLEILGEMIDEIHTMLRLSLSK